MAIADLLQDELDQRGWAQADLARVLSWPVQTISELMQGKRKIDAVMAVDLQALTGRDAEVWLTAQIARDLEEARRKAEQSERLDRIAARAELEAAVPVRELIRRGVISSTEPEAQAEEARRLIGDDPTFGASAKRSKNAVPFTRAQTAWIALARKDAREVTLKAYDEQRLAALAAALPRLVTAPEAFQELPDMFADVGVALVHVKPLPGGRIDGVSLGLDDHPMIALSGRGKRLDKVLFALLHECAHVAMGHWRQAPRVHESGDEQVVGDPKAEEAVSGLAASWVFPGGLQVHGRPITKQVVANIAKEYGVAPSVVVGQLQHEGVIEWSSALSRGLPTVEEALVTWP